MPETRDPRSVIDAAEQAAAAGDYASAEQLLREAALLQEASLGPVHPDLANTLNNLGVVCEIIDKPVDAEHYFRRAWAISSAVLEPDHPFVATSRKNLEDFCTARGKAVDLPSMPAIPPSIPPSINADRDAPATDSDDISPERPSYKESRPAASSTWSRPLASGILIAAALFVTFIVTTTWFRSTDKVESPPESPSVSSGSPPASAASPSVGAIAFDSPKQSGAKTGGRLGVDPKTGVTASTPTGRRVSESLPPPAAAKSGTKAASVPQPRLVAAARLCRDLSTAAPRGSSDWRCVPPRLPVGPGSLFFYTRLKSPTATTVQHRWYRGNRLHQVVDLPIRVNMTGGYRTYSRSTINNQGAGDWKVELRTSDGTLLHEERFVVR
jgi:hypothetical protein